MSPTGKGKETGRPLGPTGEAVRHNIKRIRDEVRRIPVTELSERMGKLGRPIPPLGLRRIEDGTRRVDADDLVTLALALGVSPSTLLVPKTDAADDQVSVTGVEGTVGALRLWKWVLAEAPLVENDRKALLEFAAQALPDWALDDVTVVESGVGPHLTTFLRKTFEQAYPGIFDGDSQ